MFTYIIIGVVFAVIVEVCISNGWNPKAPKYQQLSFSFGERILIITLWPLWLVKIIERYINRNL